MAQVVRRLLTQAAVPLDSRPGIFGRCVTGGAIALVIADGAGWHGSPKLAIPDNIVLLKLPPFAPELNPAENIWEYPRGNSLSRQVWETNALLDDAAAEAGNALMHSANHARVE